MPLAFRLGTYILDIMMEIQRKDLSIETLRGIAIVLVVGFHIVNDRPLGDAKNFYSYLAFSFQNIRMPLFTAISGYLYAVKPVGEHMFTPFMKGKTRRLLVPMFFVVTLQYLSSVLLPNVNNPEELTSIWKVYIFPYEHFWFIQAILLIFVFIGFLESSNMIGSFNRWLGALAFSILFFVIKPAIPSSMDFFSFGGAIYLCPFFLLGMGLFRYSDLTQSRYAAILTGSILVFCIFIQQLSWFFTLDINTGKNSFLGISMAISGCAVLFRFRSSLETRFIAFIGGYAYTIYLYQAFGAGLGRRIASNVLDFSGHSYFWLVLIIAVTFGLVLEKILLKTKFLKKIMLGLR